MICNICYEDKDINAFSFVKARNRHMNYCKKCNNKKFAKYRKSPIWQEYHKKYRRGKKYKSILASYKQSERGKIKHREDERNRRRRLKEEIIRHYSQGSMSCTKCSFQDIRALSVDHINGEGHKHRKFLKSTGSQQFYTWLRKHNFPQGFQILCMNCQFIKRVENNELTKIST